MMENLPPTAPDHGDQDGQDIPNGRRNSHSHRRSGSTGTGILSSKFPFLRTSSENKSNPRDPSHVQHDVADDALNTPQNPLGESARQPQQQQKTRKRKGSLRKVALLGRGARRELKPLAIDTRTHLYPGQATLVASSPDSVDPKSSSESLESAEYGLGISDVTPRPSMDGYSRLSALHRHQISPTKGANSQISSPTISCTTDDEDVLSLKTPSPPRPGVSPVSSGSESYFPPAPRASSGSNQRRRSVRHAKSPLSLQVSSLPPAEFEHDYSDTEWWGWVVLIVTWVVFVIGMGSCLGVWSWAWDVGTTPYAPPELEDDPTLPITGYYPSLIILTCIMAWVWVLIAWVGMKYFRHAKISGD